MDVRLPDGRVVRGVPEGTTKAQLMEKLNIQQPQQPKNETQPQGGYDLSSPTLPAKILANGLTSGLYNEAMGLIGTVPAWAASKLTRAPMTMGEAYERSMGQANALDEERKAFAAENQLENAAMELPAQLASIGLSARMAPNATKTITDLLRSGNLITRAGTSAALGGASTGLYQAATAEPEQRVQAGLSGAAIGSTVGAAIPVAGSIVRGIGNTIKPAIDETTQQVAQLAQKYDIPLSVDQIAGSRVRNLVQNISRSVPFSGESAFRENQLNAYNRAISRTIGQDAEKITPELMNKAFTEAGNMFDEIAKGTRIPLDTGFAQEIQQIAQESVPLHTPDTGNLLNTYANKVFNAMLPDGTIPGEALSEIRSQINRAARETTIPGGSDVLRELESVVIDRMTGGDPAKIAQMQQAKQLWRNLITIEPLAQKAVAGNISPSLLSNRASQVYGRQYTRGNAGNLGEIARVGRDLLKISEGSDTLNKALLANIAAQSAAVPATGLAALTDLGTTATALAGNRLYQSIYNRNPALVRAIIDSQPKSNNPAISNTANALIKALTGQ